MKMEDNYFAGTQVLLPDERFLNWRPLCSEAHIIWYEGKKCKKDLLATLSEKWKHIAFDMSDAVNCLTPSEYKSRES